MWVVALIAALMVLPACSSRSVVSRASASPTATPSEDDEIPQVDFSHRFLAQVRVEATGAAAFVWQGEDEVQINRIGGPGLPVNALSGGFLVPVVLPDQPKLRFRWAFDLISGYTDEPSTYTMTGQPVTEQGLADGSMFIWMSVVDPSKDAVFKEDELDFLKTFATLREPCTLVVGEAERSGSLHCPAVANDQGEVVGYRVQWRATGPSESLQQ